jgi:CheY-like chemotaxis protein
MPFSPVLIGSVSPVDVAAIREFLEKARSSLPVLAFDDGGALVGFLQRSVAHEPQQTPTRPCLLFLDLDLPKLEGFETVRWIRQQRALKDLPIILLSESVEAKDVKQAAALGVTRIVTLRPSPRAFADIIVQTARIT